jgi:hypothetical protein
MSPDLDTSPGSNPQSLNRYAYVVNNPTAMTDPNGMHCAVMVPCKEMPLVPGDPDYGEDGIPFALLLAGVGPSGYGGAFDGGCSIDGVDAACGTVSVMASAGFADPCPDDDCSQVYQNTLAGMVVKDALPNGALMLNCFGPSTSNYSCWWATYSLRFVVNGQFPYLYGDAWALYLLQTAGEEASSELLHAATGMAVNSVGGLAISGTVEFVSSAGALFDDTIVVYGQNALQSDLFHSYPSTIDNEVLDYGTSSYPTSNDPNAPGTYMEYTLPGSINGTAGQYELGGYWLWNGTFYATHRVFIPIP